jgi:hypothetical protein
MISRHVQEILAAFNSSSRITCSYKENGKKPVGLMINFSSLSPTSEYELVFELSSGKTIRCQDLEFAEIRNTPTDTIVQLGGYQFYCN